MKETLQEILNTSKEALASNAFRMWLSRSNNPDINKVLLAGKPIHNVPATVAVHQWRAVQKLRKKAPEIVEQPAIYYPPNFYLEQTSSKQTCLAKQHLLEQLNASSVIDITGGFGLDAIYLSQHVNYTHVEHQPHLQQLAAQNFATLQLPIKSVAADGIVYLTENATREDWIYADPQRRDHTNQRSFHLEDHQPLPSEVIEKGQQQNVAGTVFKLSPMVDLQVLLQQNTGSYHKAVVVVEVKQEVKEILWVLTRTSLNFTVQYIHVDGNNQLHTAAPPRLAEKEQPHQTQGKGDILYIPNPGLVKSTLAIWVAEQLGLHAIDDHRKLYGHEDIQNTPFYRQFKRLKQLPSATAALKKALVGKEYHVISFHPKIKPDAITKKLKLVPKGAHYIIFWMDGGKSTAWLAERVIIASERS